MVKGHPIKGKNAIRSGFMRRYGLKIMSKSPPMSSVVLKGVRTVGATAHHNQAKNFWISLFNVFTTHIECATVRVRVQCICISTWIRMCLCMYMCISIPITISICISISIHLPIDLSFIYRSIHLSIYISMYKLCIYKGNGGNNKI